MIDISLQLQLSAQIILAAALGAIIGAEREIHGHPAGIRTHMLVSLGAAIFTVMSVHGFGQDVNPTRVDPTRIAAQIVSGIGFLGAGAILKDGIVIRGLTTAASLWATSAVGLAAGAGEYVIAVVASAVILVSLWPINALAERLHGGSIPEVNLRLQLDRIDLVGKVSDVLQQQKVEIVGITTQRLARGSYQADLSLRGRRTSAITEALEALGGVPGVDVISTGVGD
ncbi:MAG TPA: MgtC/SapB family protein [Candidatus Limnocylindrales bacterium]|nr:MgtC/SapB family protein [Candidatus Limnocylindrales bacterium]